jgi:hypothetical protein
MSKQRHIGYVVFGICSLISARLANFEPKPHVPTAAEARWAKHDQNEDPLGLIHGLRYYVYGAGFIGLMMVAEDYFYDKQKKRKGPNQGV